MKFEQMETYIQKTREERRKHLDLTEPCIEIGGYDSREYRGLMAHYLGTTIPTTRNQLRYPKKKHKRFAILCHACDNHGCSNPKHIYWGSYSDNFIDMQKAGTQPIGVKTERQFRKPKGEAAVATQPYITEPLTEEELTAYRVVFSNFDLKKWGWVAKVSKHLKISHTHVRRLADRLELDTYKRK